MLLFAMLCSCRVCVLQVFNTVLWTWSLSAYLREFSFWGITNGSDFQDDPHGMCMSPNAKGVIYATPLLPDPPQTSALRHNQWISNLPIWLSSIVKVQIFEIKILSSFLKVAQKTKYHKIQVIPIIIIYIIIILCIIVIYGYMNCIYIN